MNTPSARKIDGTLVSLSLPGRRGLALDGFWTRDKRKSRTLLIFVHGMGSNFYKSKFKKTWMELGPKAGIDVFCFNNRGSEGAVAGETFTDCLADIETAMAFAAREGYARIYLLGHSTGCQKITYYQARRKDPRVKGLILAALGDDLAIARRDLGRSYKRWLTKARELVARGKGDTKLPPECLGFTARRFLSAVDPEFTEAKLFHLSGRMIAFSRLTLPILAVFPENEQYACIPVAGAAELLATRTRSCNFTSVIISDADHSFHCRESACVNACIRWIKKM